MGAFQVDDVGGLFHHAEEGGVPARVSADIAEVLVGQVEAALTEPDGLLGVYQGLSQRKGLFRGETEQVERQPLGRLRPDAGELREFVDEPLDGRAVQVMAPSRLLKNDASPSGRAGRV
jgi:hypothetical protein